VAVVLSTAFEGLRWHAATFAGVALCLAGNVLVLRGKAARAQSSPPAEPVRPMEVSKGGGARAVLDGTEG
jgi:hypothetical protein